MAEPIVITQLLYGQEAPAALPEPAAERLASILSAHGRLVLMAHKGPRVVGLLVGCRRRTTTMLRIAYVWIDPIEADGSAVGRAMVSALEQWSLDTDVLTWRISADAKQDDIPDSFRALTGIAPAAPGAAYSQRPLRNGGSAAISTTPIYTQSTGFTCGAACLMMAFAGFNQKVSMDRSLEVALWREATTIESTDGPGGCDPYGLALAAASRGYPLYVFMSTGKPILIDRGDTEAKRELMQFVQSEFKSRVLAAGIKVEDRAFGIAELRDALTNGSIAVVLIDQMETHGRNVPHWVVVHAASDDHFLVNDPWFEPDALETPVDVVDLPIPDAMLERMCWYGEPPYRAAIIIERTAA